MSVNLKNNRASRFQNLLYFIFQVKHRHRVDLTAEKMGVHKDTFYRWSRGDKPFPIDQLPNLVNATDDVEFLEHLADQCGYSVLPKIKNRKTAEIMTQMAKVMLSATESNEKDSDV